jgi:hypothetical protein
MKNAILVVLFLLVLAFLMNAAGNWLKAQPSPPDQKFEVVDTYKNCDVVRWTQSNFAEYKYFLDCKK